MRMCFVGKGGSGKTTLSTQFSHYTLLRNNIKNKLIIDADHNQHLKSYLERYGFKGKHITDILKEFDIEGLIKTSLPKNKNNIITLETFLSNEKIDIIYSGNYDEDKTGSSCYHGQIGKIESLLTHIIDTNDDVIISDMTAGSDIFGSSYFIHFDTIIGVCEPTFESVSVVKEIESGLKNFNINFKIIGNKIFDAEDKKFISQHFLPKNILGFVEFQRLRNKSDNIIINEELKIRILNDVLSVKKDWDNFQNNLKTFHNKNIQSWAKHIDPHPNNIKYKSIATELER